MFPLFFVVEKVLLSKALSLRVLIANGNRPPASLSYFLLSPAISAFPPCPFAYTKGKGWWYFMRKIFVAILSICLLLPLVPISVSAEPGVSAQSAIVMEATSGRVLYQKNMESRLPMASTTKIITAMVALEKGKRTDKIKVSSTAAGVEGSSMYLETGEIMTLEELLYGLMLSSGNDAAVAIAEHFGGIEKFVKMMNRKATEAGAKNTHLENPNGLPHENHYSTAYDMALLTAEGLKNPDFAKIVSTKSYSIAGEGKSYPRSLTNHNKLLKMMDDCIGVKTGFTKAAGRCLVSAVKRNGMTLICVTLNAPDDWNDHRTLYDYAYSMYRFAPILQKGIPLATVSVEKSDTTSLPLTVAENVYYPLSQEESFITELSVAPPLTAPVTSGCQGGIATIKLSDGTTFSVPLFTAGDASRSIIKKEGILHNILQWFGGIFGGKI